MNDSQKLDLILSKLIHMDTRFDGVDTRLDGMDARFDGIDTRFEGIDTRFDRIDTRFDGIDEKIENLELEIKAIKLSVENEMDRNIKTMAEWYLNLSKKSCETIQIASGIKAKQDMQDIINLYTSKISAL